MNVRSTVDPTARQREAGEFLRSRRERLCPSDVGLPDGYRRRTPGLRREEVALLAGVGTTWYTWLEQGRDVHPSNEVLSALCDALKLDDTERRHLFVLHDRPVPLLATTDERVDEPLRRMLHSLTNQPAYVLGRRWDILAWNDAADAVFGPYSRLQGDSRNAIRLIFTDPDHRRLLIDWEPMARASLAMFRADCARHAGDPDFERLVQGIEQQSPEFGRWWLEREVARPSFGRKRIDHPRVGRMDLEYSSLRVGDSPDIKLIVFTPVEGDGSARRFERLMREQYPVLRKAAAVQLAS